MSLMPLSMPGKASFVKRGRIPDIGQQHSLDASPISTRGSDGQLARRKALAPINSALDVEVPARTPFTAAAKIPGISGSEFAKTKRHDQGGKAEKIQKKKLGDVVLPKKDPFAKASKIPAILGSDFTNTKRHDHNVEKKKFEEAIQAKDPFAKASKIPAISGSDFTKTKRHDNEGPISVVDIGEQNWQDAFQKSPRDFIKSSESLGQSTDLDGTHLRRNQFAPINSALDIELPKREPFSKAATIPEISGIDRTKTNGSDTGRQKAARGQTLGNNGQSKLSGIREMMARRCGSGEAMSDDFEAHSYQSSEEGSNGKSKFPGKELREMMARRVGSSEAMFDDFEAHSYQSSEEGSNGQSKFPGKELRQMMPRRVGSSEAMADDFEAHSYQSSEEGSNVKSKFPGKELRQMMARRVGSSEAMADDFEAYSYQSTDEEDFYRRRMEQENLKVFPQKDQSQEVVDVAHAQSIQLGMEQDSSELQNDVPKHKKERKGKNKKGNKKQNGSPASAYVSKGHKFEDLPHFRQTRLRSPMDPYYGLPPWAKYYPTPPGHEKMPIPPHLQGQIPPYMGGAIPDGGGAIPYRDGSVAYGGGAMPNGGGATPYGGGAMPNRGEATPYGGGNMHYRGASQHNTMQVAGGAPDRLLNRRGGTAPPGVRSVHNGGGRGGMQRRM